MAEPATRQVNRLVQLVAELSRREEAGEAPRSVADVAAALGVTPDQVLKDLRVLTEVADDPAASWLTSLSAFQEGDAIGVRSLGPYRRPVRLTAEELLVLQVALATELEPPSEVVRTLAGLSAPGGGAPSDALVPLPLARGDEGAVVNLARLAAAECRRLGIVYVGEGAAEPVRRVVQPHDVVYAEGRYYLVSWCESAVGWRRFRADRVLEAELFDARFERRADAAQLVDQRDLFRPREGVVEVEVRFSPAIARWIRERYPEARLGRDGGVIVRFKAAGPEWVVRTVLQYGTEAEVLGPPAYREALRKAASEAG